MDSTNTPSPLAIPEGMLPGGAAGSGGLTLQYGKEESRYWMAEMAQVGASPYAPDGYKVWRNVKDYGAVGDGVTDDTAAINAAITDGGKCSHICDRSIVTPTVVYLPEGKYLVSSPVYHYPDTQIIGDIRLLISY